jgi:hypothetical protein
MIGRTEATSWRKIVGSVTFWSVVGPVIYAVVSDLPRCRFPLCEKALGQPEEAS